MNQLGEAGLGDAGAARGSRTGPNKPVDPNALGRGARARQGAASWPAQSGLDVGALLPMLAAALPTIINAITPDGKVPRATPPAGLDLGGVLEGLSRGRERRARARRWRAVSGALLGGRRS